MRTRYHSVILCFVLLVSSLRTFAQSIVPATDSVAAVFTKFKQIHTAKSIVLLTDRNVYMVGEKIWFKAYLVNQDNAKLDFTMRNLFADLVNEKDSLIEQLVLDNINLHTNGAFRLPESIPTGFYWIRCYTARQVEGDSSGIFLHPVYIVNKQLHDEGLYAKQFEAISESGHKSNPFIHFFAERLTAIPGIISTGVIEIKDGYKNALSVNGVLVNSKDSVIANFKTNSFGLARLTFLVDSGEQYTAIFHLNDHAIRYQLPAVDRTSIQLSVKSQTAKTIRAFVTLEDSVPADMHTSILAVQRDSLYYAAVGTGNYGLTIPLDNFPGGIVRLLLFDRDKTLVSERKIYIPKENVELEIKPDKEKYSERENVNVRIKLKGPNDKPLVSALNVSVQDESIEQFSDSIEANALPPSSAFLLDSWLNRRLMKYAADDIDLLLATRKSIFDQSSATALTKKIQDYDDNKKLQNLMGKIINPNGDGMSDRIVTAIAKNTDIFFMDADTTDKNGAFRLSIPQGVDSLQFSLQVTDKHQVQTFSDSIKIDSFHFPNLSTPLSLKQQLQANYTNTVVLSQKYPVDTTVTFKGKGLLAPVTVKAIKKVELNYDASKRLASISQILTSDKFRYGGFNAIGNAVLMVPGVTLSGGDISIFGPTGPRSLRPLIIMDGIEMPSSSSGGNIMGFLNGLNPAEIDFIEVLRGGEAGIYGGRGAGGVISINTKHGSAKTNRSNNNLRVFIPVSYHVSPKFEMPDYSNMEIKNRSNPDPRTTIYWDGNITTDMNGEASINFYTGDNITNYAITITGLTSNGDLVYKRVIIAITGKSH